MDQYYIGKQYEYIEVQYARSDRSQCRGCKQNISKQDIRVSISLNEDHFQGKTWYHLDCFQLKPRHASFNPEKQIFNLNQLEKADQQKVILYFKVIIGKFNKKDGPANKSKSAMKQKNKEKKEKKSNKSVSKNKKTNKQSQQNESQPESFNISSSQQSIKPKKKKAPAKKAARSKPAQKQKPKSEKKEKKRVKKIKKIAGGYTQQQQQKYHQYCEYFQKMTSQQLKNILSLNAQGKTGSKSELVSKCADGKLLGGIPRCEGCGGGRLRYNHTNGIYTCPGYMQDQDFVHCNMTFTENQVKRSKWQQL